MNREKLIKKTADAIHEYEGHTLGCGKLSGECGGSVLSEHEKATWVVDALLPQVTTVEELEALPDYTMLLTTADDNAREGGPIPNTVLLVRGVLLQDWERVPDWLRNRWLRRGPLTIVWQP